MWITTNWKILQEMGIPDHLTCLLRNLYAGQEPTEADMEPQWTSSKLGKKYIKAVYYHPAYLTYMRNAWLDEAQAGIKMAGRNINNLRYADDNILMAENKKELTSLLMKVKEFQKNIYFCFTEYTKAFDCVDHNKLWESLKRERNTRPPVS